MNTTMKLSSAISFHTEVNELILIGNTFKHNTVQAGSFFLNLNNIKNITMAQNHFFNISYSEAHLTSTLINIGKNHLVQLSLKSNIYEDSQLNFMNFEGFSSTNLTG